jgi:hypothetical protein
VVERKLPKLDVEGSIPFARSNKDNDLAATAEDPDTFLAQKWHGC